MKRKINLDSVLPIKRMVGEDRTNGKVQSMVKEKVTITLDRVAAAEAQRGNPQPRQAEAPMFHVDNRLSGPRTGRARIIVASVAQARLVRRSRTSAVQSAHASVCAVASARDAALSACSSR